MGWQRLLGRRLIEASHAFASNFFFLMENEFSAVLSCLNFGIVPYVFLAVVFKVQFVM